MGKDYQTSVVVRTGGEVYSNSTYMTQSHT